MPTPSAAEEWSRLDEPILSDRIGAEFDLQDLAAVFAAHGGTRISPELSADLALEIVLNEIVEQACLATGATGAAIVLERDGEMVCRATNGATAPELGARLDTESGLSAACVRTKQLQRSDDTLTDLRADVAASQQLGIRSVMVYPLLRGPKLVGIFEIFSPRPHAFGQRDERTLEVLAQRIFRNLDHKNLDHKNLDRARLSSSSSAALLENPTASPTALQAFDATLPALDPPPVPTEEVVAARSERAMDVLTWALGFAVLACAVLFGILVGQRFAAQRIAHRPSVKIATPVQNVQTSSPAPTLQSAGKAQSASVSTSTSSAKTTNPPLAKPDPPAPGSLLVYQNGKEVFRMPPVQGAPESQSPADSAGIERAASIEPERMELSPADAESNLLRRVEPDYPEQARVQQIEGAVVLDVQIAASGSVKFAKVVSGPPQLTQTAIEAVKQWKFKPQTVNGRPVEMQTTITLNFRLPH